MQSFRIGSAGLLFLVFNLAGIPILSLVLRPLFEIVSSGQPGAASIAMSVVHFLFLIGTNIGLAIWAWRTEPVRWVARAIAIWTGISTLTAFTLASITPWAILQSLVLFAMIRTN